MTKTRKHPNPPGPVCLYLIEPGRPESRMDFDTVEEALDWVAINVEEGARVQFTHLAKNGDVILEGDALKAEIGKRRKAIAKARGEGPKPTD